MNNRLINLFLWDVKRHRGNIVKAVVAISIILSLMNIVILCWFRGPINSCPEWEYIDRGSYESQCLIAMAKTVFRALCIYMILSASQVFKNMRSKQQRIVFLTLPTTNAEKFIERVLYIWVVNLLIFIIGFVVSDIVQFLFSYVITPDYHRLIVGNLNVIDMSDATAAYVVLILCIFLWAHSSYVLGGALFRRSPILLTTCVHAIVCILLTIVFIVGGDNLLDSFDDLSNNQRSLFFSVPFLLALIFDYWAAYKLFTHSKLMTRKWFNL